MSWLACYTLLLKPCVPIAILTSDWPLLQVLKLLALAHQGADVFGEPTAFRRWLGKPAYGLDSQPPLALLQTSGGIDLVAEEVSRIA